MLEYIISNWLLLLIVAVLYLMLACTLVQDESLEDQEKAVKITLMIIAPVIGLLNMYIAIKYWSVIMDKDYIMLKKLSRRINNIVKRS